MEKKKSVSIIRSLDVHKEDTRQWKETRSQKQRSNQKYNEKQSSQTKPKQCVNRYVFVIYMYKSLSVPKSVIKKHT